MKKKTAMTRALVGAGIACAFGAQGAVSLNLASVGNAAIQFNPAVGLTPASFQFTDASGLVGPFSKFNGNEWHITSESTGTSSVGDIGNFTDTAGAIWNYGPVQNYGGGIQQATVTPAAGQVVTLGDGHGGTLTGALNWGIIQTSSGQVGINTALSVNVTGLTYTGYDLAHINPDFVALAANGTASLDVTVAFSPGVTLNQLEQGSYSQSFSGSFSLKSTPPPPPPPVPEAGTTIAGGIGLGVVVLLMALQARREKAVTIK